VLERLITAVGAAVLATLTPDTPEWVAYFGRYTVTSHGAQFG
jgi:hypothetical protein